MTDEDFAQLIVTVHEQRGVEFKGPGPLSNSRLAAQVVRAALGMANIRGGGSIIIGVEESGNYLNPVGVSSPDLATWTYDRIADQFARYADPGIRFESEAKNYNDSHYVVIEIAEFEDIPVLCKRSYDDLLRDGACYVRPRRKPETSEIPTQADMRDLLDLATVKWIRHHADWAQRAGILPLVAESSVVDNEALFDHDARDIL